MLILALGTVETVASGVVKTNAFTNILFGAHYGLGESLAPTFLKTKLSTLLLKMVYFIGKCCSFSFHRNKRLELR